MNDVRKSLVGALALFGAVALTSNANAACVQTIDNSGVECFTLYAGQSIEAGSVCVEIVGDDLVVSYETTGGWELAETHVWAGTTANGWPQTRKGNPRPGQFPYNSGDITGATSYDVTVPGAAADCDANWYLAAHAAVRKDNGDGTYQTETGWSDGTDIVERGSWATYSEFYVQCEGCTVTPGILCYRTETAFAFGGVDLATCFLDIDEDGDEIGDFNRWGWTNAIPEGNYTWTLWAGAGQCDTDKGTNVGTLTVNYASGTATVTYDMIGDFALLEAQVYVGSEILARNNGFYTVAPGQYSVVDDENPTGVYTFDGLSGDIHVVAHASVGMELIDACPETGKCPTKDVPCVQ